MSKYTAEDFANAQFAEHADSGCLAVRQTKEHWLTDDCGIRDGRQMAAFGWVPVPTKPTITESEFEEIKTRWGKITSNAWLRGFTRAGGVIIPDPEPTNAEKLADVYRSWCGRDEVPNSLIRFMDEAGVAAPEETK